MKKDKKELPQRIGCSSPSHGRGMAGYDPTVISDREQSGKTLVSWESLSCTVTSQLSSGRGSPAFSLALLSAALPSRSMRRMVTPEYGVPETRRVTGLPAAAARDSKISSSAAEPASGGS